MWSHIIALNSLKCENWKLSEEGPEMTKPNDIFDCAIGIVSGLQQVYDFFCVYFIYLFIYFAYVKLLCRLKHSVR